MQHISETRIRIVADGVEQARANRAPNLYQGKVLEIEVDGKIYHLESASGCDVIVSLTRCGKYFLELRAA